ncbi:MAG: TOBE domain-containing protein [Chloroflexi bacterium]|nr:TOBE domain-containing protein [Chloroflexota bacterium]
MVDWQYIGTDTRYILRLGERLELGARLQNLDDRPKAIFAVGQAVTVRWSDASTTVLDH